MILGPFTVVVGLWSTVHFSSNGGYPTMENQDKVNFGKNIGWPKKNFFPSVHFLVLKKNNIVFMLTTLQARNMKLYRSAICPTETYWASWTKSFNIKSAWLSSNQLYIIHDRQWLLLDSWILTYTRQGQEKTSVWSQNLMRKNCPLTSFIMFLIYGVCTIMIKPAVPKSCWCFKEMPIMRY